MPEMKTTPYVPGWVARAAQPEGPVIYLAIMPADIPGLCYAATYDEAGNMVENLNELTMAQVSYIAAQRNLRVVTTG